MLLPTKVIKFAYDTEASELSNKHNSICHLICIAVPKLSCTSDFSGCTWSINGNSALKEMYNIL